MATATQTTEATELPPRTRMEDIEGDFPMDDAVIRLFAPGSTVLSAESYGASAWTQTGCVTVELPDGELKKYFLKLSFRELGQNLLLGEFTSIALMDSLCPGMVPKPLGWGKYDTGFPETYFFIEDFIDMNLDLPDPAKLAKRAAELHNHISPNGMFGFPVTTYAGKVSHITIWEPHWTKFYTRFLRNTFRMDEEANGHWPELAMAFEHVMTVVAPRLLDVLQTGPDPIVPRLLHGDFWAENMGTDEETGEIIFYDAGCYYGHNEMELGMWRKELLSASYLGQGYLREYQQVIPPAEPKAEFDDRNRLYALKYLINFSVGHPGAIERHHALNDLAYLCEKYAPLEGIPKYDPQKDYAPRSRVMLGAGSRVDSASSSVFSG